MHAERIGIKICGITSLDEIVFLNDADIDYIGFVFAKSPRRIDEIRAVELASALRESILKVGVFTEVNPEAINNLFKKGIIDIAQIHTDERKSLDRLKMPVWVSVSIKKENTTGSFCETDSTDGIHLDTYDPDLAGGTGRTFDWDAVNDLKINTALILAGGLNPKNVQKALSAVRADVVDVSSGVEIIEAGKRSKSRELVEDFIQEVRKYECTR